MMKTGDLIIVISHEWEKSQHGRRGYSSYPRVRGFHKSIFVLPDTIGIILEKRNDYYRISFDSREVWMNMDKVKKL